MTFKKWINHKFSHTERFKNLLNQLKDKKILHIGGLFESANTLLISSLANAVHKPIIYVCKDENEAKMAELDLESYSEKKVSYFPSLETTPYQSAIIDESITSKRLEVLKNLVNIENQNPKEQSQTGIQQNNQIIIVSIDTLLFHITPRKYLLPYINIIKTGVILEIEILSKQLIQSGYRRVSQVTTSGEFSIRGDIFDIYYSIDKNPIRIDFFDNQVESIKTFNPITQSSIETLNEAVIPPHKEFVYGEKEVEQIKQILFNLEGGRAEKDEIWDKITHYQSFYGEQYYLSLFYEKVSLLDYFQDVIVVINDFKTIKKRAETLLNEFNENYLSTANRNKPRVRPEKILFTLDEIYDQSPQIIECNHLESSHASFDAVFDFRGIPVYLGNLELFKTDIGKYLQNNYRIVLFAGTVIQSERLNGVFKDFNPKDDRFEFYKTGFSILPLHLANGFVSEELKTFFLNDSEIFGKRKISRHYYTRRTEVIDSFLDLKPGDYVVHINHGIGRFLGIDRVSSFGNEKDYISILYADDDKIFIPVEQLNFIQKYISQEFSKPKLDKIGAKGWNRTKERVKESIEKLAKELIKLYAFRLEQKGFAFLPDTVWQKEFESKFPYEETEDQLLTLEEVKRDMESIKPMDRLICGDVGFGKTEIAIRAAFKAVMSGKQVVMLVPTTILTEQHFETFSERLKDYPIKVDMLSRFRTKEEQEKVIEELKTGEIDIIIGTHRLLSNDIMFKNPGLYIIDEEQRFGVKHKEKIKNIRMSIDCLSMTATPIPRTLHMSLANIRNISIINTPPLNRQSVETYVLEFNEEIMLDAIKRELDRQGQIFFLHNRIKTIYSMKTYLEKLIPGARIVVAHGQLNEEELEDIIHQFLYYEYDILLATTIIESGIDMPRVNTIFIDQADKFGLSQLYQLRGRVGRSDRKAYAYLFYHPDIVLTEDAMKRLTVISEYTELGSGFKIAMKDLEIRGAGNLLGPEQHGDILAVGFQLYCKLLSEAINELAPEETKNFKQDTGEVYIDLKYTGFIPNNYITDQKQKMEFYKKIASILYPEEIPEIQKTMIDRFGKIPEEITALFYVAEIRILARKLRAQEVVEKNDTLEIKFNRFADIKIADLMKTIFESQGKIYLNGRSPDTLFIKLKEFRAIKDKIEYIKNTLQQIVIQESSDALIL